MSFLERVVASRVGQILFVIHLVFAAYVYATREPFSEREFNFTSESLALKAFILLNLPALAVATVLSLPLGLLMSLYPSFWKMQRLIDVIGFFCASAQWWIIGYYIERLYRRAVTVNER